MRGKMSLRSHLEVQAPECDIQISDKQMNNKRTGVFVNIKVCVKWCRNHH